jgi:hypothetical protein
MKEVIRTRFGGNGLLVCSYVVTVEPTSPAFRSRLPPPRPPCAHLSLLLHRHERLVPAALGREEAKGHETGVKEGEEGRGKECNQNETSISVHVSVYRGRIR